MTEKGEGKYEKNSGRVFTVLMICMLSSLTVLSATTAATIGDNEYTSLAAALKAVEDGQTIVLAKNVSYSKNLTVSLSDKSITIDLNEKTIAFKGSSYLKVKSGTITFKNGKIKNSNGNTVMTVNSGATVKIAGGTYTGIITNAGKLTISKGTFKTQIENKGTLTIKGGTFAEIKKNYDDSEVSSGILVNDGGTTTIKNGTFTAASRCNMLVNNKNSTLKISGGTFTCKSKSYIGGTVLYNEGKVTISGGTLAARNYCQYAILNEGGTLALKDGTISQTSTNGHCAVITVGGVVKMSGGSIISMNGYEAVVGQQNYKITITGGSLTVNNTQAILLYGISSYSVSSNVVISGTGNHNDIYIITE
ncbi:MAG: hypothetical protein LUF30_07365 [Lachnospiraceae bacterium]|nr:hypothetical protein [Lachnospiraceae bacterium]